MTGRGARRVTVVGAGAVGLAVAHELAAAGDRVTVVSDAPARDSVSAVAGALWFPYVAERSERVSRWMRASRERFEELARDPRTGVDLREGLVVERAAHPDRSWTAAVAGFREARPEELPRGATGGVRATVPVVMTPQYLAWLEAACAGLGVVSAGATVRDLGEVTGSSDLVVVAAGLRAGPLLGDDTGTPVRGQVVRLRDPGLSGYHLDEDHPDGLTYVIPRRGDVVCGGTAEPGETGTVPDPGTERAILARAVAAVPALAGAPVVGRAVGLRPARPTVRVEAVDGWGVPVVACYGHGGAGVSLSWGCAQEVLALAGA